MEIKIFVVLILLQICHLSSAAILKLAGRVPDRGFTLTEAKIEPVKNSDLKVYISSEGSKGHSQRNSQENLQWRRVTQAESTATASNIKVQAP